MSEIPDLDLIEKYLLGKMNEPEIRNFELRLEDDRELRRKLRLIRSFPEMMSEAGRTEYENNQSRATEKPVKKKKSFRYPKRIYLAGASVAAIILIAILLFVYTGTDSENDTVVKEKNGTTSETPVSAITTARKDTVVGSSVQTPVKKEILDVPVQEEQKTIELLKPAEGMKFSKKDILLFNWAQKTDTFTRFYIVSELHDQVVFWRGIRPGIREYKVPGDYLFPGTYYWFVGTKSVKRTFIVTE